MNLEAMIIPNSYWGWVPLKFIKYFHTQTGIPRSPELNTPPKPCSTYEVGTINSGTLEAKAQRG